MTKFIANEKHRHAGMKLTGSDIAFTVLVYAILLFALIVVSYPLIYVVSASFSSPGAVSSGKVTLFPVQPTLLAYKTNCFTTSQFIKGSPPKKSTSRFVLPGEFSIRKSSARLPTSKLIKALSP